jgi:hypothetical protein
MGFMLPAGTELASGSCRKKPQIQPELVLRQLSFEESNRSGRDVRAPGARASRPLTTPQFIPDNAIATNG